MTKDTKISLVMLALFAVVVAGALLIARPTPAAAPGGDGAAATVREDTHR